MSEEFIKLYQAIVSDDQKVYTELRNSNTDGNIPLNEIVKHSEDTLLHVAANWNRRHIAEILIDLRPSLLLATNAKGETPLHAAASAGSEAVTRVIIERCHQIEALETGEIFLRKKSEKEKETALHKAVRNGHFEVVKLLIHEDPELTKLVNKDGDSPLFMAVDTWRFEIARDILTVSDCSFKGRKNMNALHAAIAHHLQHQTAREIVSCLIQKRDAGLAEQQEEEFGWTPLHFAAYMNDTQIIQQLVSAKHSVACIRDNNGMTALHIAAKQGHVRAVEKLVKICPDICGIVDDKGHSFFHIAAKSGRIKVVRFILGKRYYLIFDLLVYIIFFSLPLDHAFHFGCLHRQLFAGDFLNMQDYQGNTALHLAASEKHFFISFLLGMDRRLSKATTNSDGFTVSDILIQSQSASLLAKQGLCTALASGGKPGIKHLLKSKEIKKSNEPKSDEAVEKSWRETNLLVSTIIATVSFTAALSVPGGFKNDGPAEGTAALGQKSDFRKFVIFNAIAYGLSVFSLLTSWYIPGLSSILNHLTWIMSQIAILAIAGAFYYGSSAVLGPSEAKLANKVGNIMSACGLPLLFAIDVALMTLLTVKWRTLRYLRA